MENKKKNIPRRRFEGFTEDWEQRKWIDVVDISTEMVNPTSGEYDNMPHIAPGNIESFTGRILDNVKTVKEEQLISGKFRFRPDDVVYGKINPQLGKYFYATVNGLTSADAYVFNGKNGLKQKFLFAILQTSDFFKYSVSVSKRSGMPKINRDELNAYSFFMPSEEEQDKIGSYLLQLDHLITLHQRKLDKLRAMKKSYLSEMFPQAGEKKPRRRFKGFTEDWEQRKFGDVGSVSMCKRIFKNETSDGGDIPFYKIGTFGGEPDAYISRELFEEYKQKFSYPDEGDILLSASGTIGRIVEYTGEEAYFQDSNIVWLSHDKSICNKFLKVLYPTVKWDGIEGSTIKRLYNDNFLKTQFMMPKLEEQERLGEYFEQLDNLITLHQRKLEKLKNIKQAYLNEMFV